MLPGKTNTVTIAHFAQGKDTHGAKADGAEILEDRRENVDAVIGRSSRENLWKIVVAGNLSAISSEPKAWSITSNDGRTFNCQRATFRPPIERLGESEHTLIFAEQVGEMDTEARF